MNFEQEIREIIEYYAAQRNPKEQENIIAMLREIQETEGCIPLAAQELAAEKLGVKRSVFTCIMKRLPDLKEEIYSHQLVLCTGERCQNKKSMEILKAVKEELKIDRRWIFSGQKNLSEDAELYEAMQDLSKHESRRRIVCCCDKRAGLGAFEKMEIKEEYR